MTLGFQIPSGIHGKTKPVRIEFFIFGNVFPWLTSCVQTSHQQVWCQAPNPNSTGLWLCVLLRDELHYCWLHCGNCEVWWKTDNRMDLFPRALAWFWLPEKGRSQCFSKQLFWVVPHCRIIFPLLHNKKSLCMIIKPRRTWESGTSVTQWTNLQGPTM